MSNRDGRKAKRNAKSKFSTPNKICPVCQNTLDKCADHSALVILIIGIVKLVNIRTFDIYFTSK
ncbi:hypothetical protein BRC2024_ULFKEANI_CDS_0149 [Acinetobacter phage vB_AbaM_Konradin-v2]